MTQIGQRSLPIRRVPVGRALLHAVTLPQALARVGELVANGGGTVFTPNVDHIVRAERDPAFAATYDRAALQLCDGMPVKWAAGLFGGVPSKQSGSTFLPELLAHASDRNLRAYFVGGRVGVTGPLQALMSARFPGVQVVGHSAPTRELLADPDAGLAAVAAAIEVARPDLVLVSLTSPLQERWADAVHLEQGRGVFVCTGSAVDMLVGLVRPAPHVLSQIGLEWFWRMVLEPRRLAGRYAGNARGFAPILLRQWRAGRHG